MSQNRAAYLTELNLPAEATYSDILGIAPLAETLDFLQRGQESRNIVDAYNKKVDGYFSKRVVLYTNAPLSPEEQRSSTAHDDAIRKIFLEARNTALRHLTSVQNKDGDLLPESWMSQTIRISQTFHREPTHRDDLDRSLQSMNLENTVSTPQQLLNLLQNVQHHTTIFNRIPAIQLRQNLIKDFGCFLNIANTIIDTERKQNNTNVSTFNFVIFFQKLGAEKLRTLLSTVTKEDLKKIINNNLFLYNTFFRALENTIGTDDALRFILPTIKTSAHFYDALKIINPNSWPKLIEQYDSLQLKQFITDKDLHEHYNNYLLSCPPFFHALAKKISMDDAISILLPTIKTSAHFYNALNLIGPDNWSKLIEKCEATELKRFLTDKNPSNFNLDRYEDEDAKKAMYAIEQAPDKFLNPLKEKLGVQFTEEFKQKTRLPLFERITAIETRLCQELDTESASFLKRKKVQSATQLKPDDKKRYDAVNHLRLSITRAANDNRHELHKEFQEDRLYCNYYPSEASPWKRENQEKLMENMQKQVVDNIQHTLREPEIEKYKPFEKFLIKLLNIVTFLFAPIKEKFFTPGSWFYSREGKSKEAVQRTLDIAEKTNFVSKPKGP